MADVLLLQGDCRDVLKTLEAESVQTVVTSPPYWGLRDYGAEGQIGQEPTPDEYVASLVAVFRDVWRVLRPDGTLWLNLGDCYASSGIYHENAFEDMGQRLYEKGQRYSPTGHGGKGRARTPPGLKPKDLVGIPWRVAFALQTDGWYLRSDIIWAKANPMPESVTDRPTKAHEYIFLLSKNERYYYDADAIKEPAAKGSAGSSFNKGKTAINGLGRVSNLPREEDEYRNKRSVWTVATQPYPGAHYAVFPEALIEPCILAGSRPGDVVLDPFAGSGTTGRVAVKHNRKAILIEINPEYIQQQEQRTDGVQRSLLGMEAA